MTLLATSTRADDACGKHPSVGLHKGRTAPFDGVLVQPPCLTARASELRILRARLEAEQQVCAVEINLRRRSLLVEKQRLQETREALALMQERAEGASMWGVVGLAVGVVVGAGAVIGIVYAVQP